MLFRRQSLSSGGNLERHRRPVVIDVEVLPGVDLQTVHGGKFSADGAPRVRSPLPERNLRSACTCRSGRYLCALVQSDVIVSL
jgi:hypothetical protein